MKYEHDEELPAYCGAVGGAMFALGVMLVVIGVAALVVVFT